MHVHSDTHINLAVRPDLYMPYCVQGDDAEEIGRYHGCAREAEAAVRAYCRTQRRTATIRVFTPRNNLWKEDEIAADGTVASTSPRWLLPTSKAA